MSLNQNQKKLGTPLPKNKDVDPHEPMREEVFIPLDLEQE
jgi:hypothetical protein